MQCVTLMDRVIQTLSRPLFISSMCWIFRQQKAKQYPYPKAEMIPKQPNKKYISTKMILKSPDFRHINSLMLPVEIFQKIK